MTTLPCPRCQAPVQFNARSCAACGVYFPGGAARVASRQAARSLVCTRCGHVGPASEHAKGSGWIEVILYLWLIVPGLIYSVWRRSDLDPRCALCGSTDLVPESSPVGAELVARTHR